MKLFLGKKRLFLIYIFFALWGAVVLGLNRFSETSSLSLMLTFFLLLLAPGFCLARIFKIELKDEKIGQLILWITLGLILALSFCFLAVFLGWTLNNLAFIYLTSLALLALIALILDFLRPVSQISYLEGKPLKLKDIFTPDLLIYLLLAIVIILILSSVDFRGANFKGDPFFHLAIMRKAIGGQPLTPENLNFVKGQLHPAYAFPVWHIFMSFLAKILNINIFTIWRELPFTLTIFSLMVWYFLFRKLLPTRGLAFLAFLLFMIFTYSIESPGYLFMRLPVPDTFNQFILLPLLVSLAIKYIFDRSANYKILIVLSMLAIFTGIIHLTQYFYFIFALVTFGLVYSILKFRDPDFRTTLKRIIFTIFTNVIMILPFILALELRGKTIFNTLKIFFNDKEPRMTYYPFGKMPLLSKFDYLFLPLVLLFIRKYSRLIFLLGLFLMMPIFYYFTFLRIWLARILTTVWVNRLFSNVNWSFAIWALILGFIIILIDRLISRIASVSRYLRYLVDFTLSLLAIWLLWLEERHQGVSLFYNKVFSLGLDQWLGRNYYWLILIILVMVSIVLLLQRRFPKVGDLFTLTEFKNRYAAYILVFSLVLFMSAPMYSSFQYFLNLELQSKHFIAKAEDPFYSLVNPVVYGGPKASAFINENIPPKSVILIMGQTDYSLSLVVDQYMAAYADLSGMADIYSKIYLKDIPIQEKIGYVNTAGIEYILDNSRISSTEETGLDDYPEYFTPIFATTETYYRVNEKEYQAVFTIYKVNIANVKRDLNL